MNIIITGATKGIGLALVKLFALQGFNVAFCARTVDAVNGLVAELQNKYPTQSFFGQSVDMREKTQVKAFGKEVLAHFKTIDILVNNAGVFLPGAISKEDEDTLETLIETNVYSAYHLTRTILPAMIAQNDGHIFNMCSIASITAYPTGGSYSISKFALLGFSKVLREELKPKNIRVTALLPGATLTPAWGETSLPESRFMAADDIAKIVLNVWNLGKSTVVEEILIRPQLGDI
ncbi:MAG: hypothetical protein RI894_1583 [Bacteroidota bacterium]